MSKLVLITGSSRNRGAAAAFLAARQGHAVAQAIVLLPSEQASNNIGALLDAARGR